MKILVSFTDDRNIILKAGVHTLQDLRLFTTKNFFR